MASKVDIKTARLHLTVCRTQVTKAINHFEKTGKELEKNEQGTQAKKLRLSAQLMESLEDLKSKVKKMEKASEVTIETILAEDEEKLSKKKEEIVEDYVAENDGYLESSNAIQVKLEALVEKAEEIIAGVAREPVSGQARPTSDPAAQAAVGTAVSTTNNNDF